MEEIKLKERPIERAVSDYLRAKKNQLKFLKDDPFTMTKVLDQYDSSVLEVTVFFKVVVA